MAGEGVEAGLAGIHYVVAALIGGLVGLGELVSRYRDEPRRAMWSMAAGLYVALNATAGIVALGLINLFGVNFGVRSGGTKLVWTQTLVAGFGAVALFRTSLFVAKVGEQDIGFGPSGVLQVLLNVADRSVDRKRARGRADAVKKIMENVSFDKAHAALPTFAMGLMQNLSKEEQEAVGRQVGDLARGSLPPRAKSYALGLLLLNLLGEETLRVAVAALGDLITDS